MTDAEQQGGRARRLLTSAFPPLWAAPSPRHGTAASPPTSQRGSRVRKPTLSPVCSGPSAPTATPGSGSTLTPRTTRPGGAHYRGPGLDAPCLSDDAYRWSPGPDPHEEGTEQ